MRGGRTKQARACFKILGHSTLSAQAHMHLAASYKREKEWAEAVKTCQQMIAQGAGGVWPYIELAKYYEHIAKDNGRALSYANGALRYTLNVAPLWGADEQQMAQVDDAIAVSFGLPGTNRAT